PAWHGLGQCFDEPMTSVQALEGAGLGWSVEQENAYRFKQAYHFGGSDSYQSIPGFRLNVRSDSREVLGMVSDHYKVVQNTEAFAFLDELVEGHEMMYESAFSLRGGRKVVLLAKMPGVRQVVEGDTLLDYVLLSLGHDGTEAVQFGPTSVRVVCANTHAMAVREGNQKRLAIRHAGNIKEKLGQARSILALASDQFAQYAETGRRLAERRLSQSEWVTFLDVICPELDPMDPDYTDRRAVKIADRRFELLGAFCNERQATAPRSAW
ncbi:unnamed protein product, partial [marine sediment metagenome]